MKRFWGFVQKEIYHILRDSRTLLILFGMPIVQILLFGYAVTNEIKEARIATYDAAQDVHSRAIRQKLLASGYFVLEDNLAEAAEMEAAFRKGKIKMVVRFEPHMAEKIGHEGGSHIQLIADATDPNTANTLVNYASGIIADYQQELAGGAGMPLQVKVETRMRYNPQLKGVFLFVPGLITIILMLVSAMMTSIAITREKEMGTMEVLLVSPMRAATAADHPGKVTPYLILAMANAVLILLLGYYVFGVPIVGSIWLLLAEGVLFVMSALSLGILISTVAATQQVALLISLMGLMLPTILLSGFIFPIENMPLPLQWVSQAIPARWFVSILKAIMLQGLGLKMLWKESLILLGFTLFFLLLSVRRFQIRLE